jgi:hypothetical protein
MFWENTIPEPNTGCWLWMGCVNRDGYGGIRVDGRTLGTHRFAALLTFGPIPDGLVVMHRCDNPPCVNPAHLRLGTDSDNARDKAVKGRAWGHSGAEHPRAKLTPGQVEDARRRRDAGEMLKVIAKDLNIHPDTLSRAIRGMTWHAR